MPGLPVHHQLPEFIQTHVHRVGDAIQPSHPQSSPSPPAPKSLPASESFPMSQLFTKYWSFSFSIIPSKEHLGLISFTIDWLDLLAVQGTLLFVCFIFYFYFILLYNTVLVLPFIDMNQPWVYMSSQS